MRAVNARMREERRSLCGDTRQMSWVDWLQQQATNGRTDALEALRVARGRGKANTISAPRTATVPPLDAQAQVTKQGTVIQKVGEHEIRDTAEGLNVATNVGDDVLLEMIARASERYEGGLTAYGPADFQLRIARVAGANYSNHHGSRLESLEPEHRPDPLLYSPVILLDHVVQVFAGSHLYAAW